MFSAENRRLLDANLSELTEIYGNLLLFIIMKKPLLLLGTYYEVVYSAG